MTDFLQPVSAVIFVLSLLGTALYFLRRRGMASFPNVPSPFGRQGTTVRQLKVVERVPLGPQHALHLVRMGDRLILIATAPGSCQMLDSVFREGTGL